MVSPIRMSGMASGMDTETMVKDLMKAHRMPLNKLFQKRQMEEWKRDSYRDINSLLLDLRNSKVFDLRLERTFTPKTVTSENETAVFAKSTGNPSLNTYSIKVDQLAQPSTPTTATFTTTLPNATTAVGANNGFEFKLNGSTITVSDTDTINSVISKVNAVSSTTGATATYFNNKLVFTSKTSGAGQTIDIQVTTPPASGTNVLGLSNTTVSNGTNGTPGQVVINGVTQSITSNTFTYDGIEFTAKQTTAAPLNVNVKTNEDAIFNSIKSFVDKYNEVIDKLNSKLTERKYRDYQPLLDEEKEGMSEKQIEKWENKAKSGLLRQDSILSGSLNDMRRSLSTVVSGADTNFNTLKDIGISTSSFSENKYAWAENGKLYIDETKLRDAIRNNGDKVMQLFTKKSSITITSTSTAADKETYFNESGIAQRLYDKLDSSLKKIGEKAGASGALFDTSIIGKSIDNINKQISTWEDRLISIEDRYWKQFNAMENSLQKLNAQGSWLSQQLGGGQ